MSGLMSRLFIRLLIFAVAQSRLLMDGNVMDAETKNTKDQSPGMRISPLINFLKFFHRPQMNILIGKIKMNKEYDLIEALKRQIDSNDSLSKQNSFKFKILIELIIALKKYAPDCEELKRVPNDYLNYIDSPYFKSLN